MKFLSFSLVLLLLSNAYRATAASPDPKQLLIQMMDQISQVKSLSYTFRKKERIHQGFSNGIQDIKLSTQPLKAHIYVHTPNKGTVVVWSENENNGDLQVSPGWLPFVTVNRSPDAEDVRTDNHHSIDKVGFEFVSDIVNHSLKKHANHLSEVIHYGGQYVINNRLCHKVIIDFKEYKYINYTVKANENIFQIAERYKVNEFMILLNNPQLKNFISVKAGQVIRLPTEYAKTTELYIDQENRMPIVQKMYDEKGLFEHYEYINLQYNPTFKDSFFLASAGKNN